MMRGSIIKPKYGPLRPYWYLTTLFVLSVFVQITFFSLLPAQYRQNESSDFTSFYAPVARNILEGRGIVTNDGDVALRYPPGYPLILAGVFSVGGFWGAGQDVALQVLAYIISGLITVLVYSLARQLWSPSYALIVGIAWLTYPAFLWMLKQPNSEAPFLVFFYGALCLFLVATFHARRVKLLLVLSGLLFGLAILVRPVAVGLPILLAATIWLIWRHRQARVRIMSILLFVTSAVIVVLPWEAWVYHNTGDLIPLSSGGLPSIRDGLTFAVDSEDYRRQFHYSEDVELLMQAILVRQKAGELNTIGAVGELLKQELHQHPLAVAELLVIKAFRSWYATDSGRLERPLLALQLGYLLAAILGGAQMWKQKGVKRQALILVGLITLYFWAMTTLVLSIVRYMIPAMGLLFLLIPGILPRKDSA